MKEINIVSKIEVLSDMALDGHIPNEKALQQINILACILREDLE